MPRNNENFIQYFSRILSNSLRLDISNQRAHIVYESIADGSQPEVRFYVMVVVSTLIAGFGLITNSTAVVIGAMLVAPLMTPIFGISLALVREDADLMNRAIRAEVMGMFMAVAMGYGVGFLLISVDPYISITPEMLSRTRPNLADLAVAVLAGLAGAYALIDEKISPALPGVAIATAIVPPLGNSGLCLAFGAYNGALGSFLLFFTNFISILLVSSILFYRAGMHRVAGITDSDRIVRKVGLTAVGFVIMVVVLAHSLIGITRHRITEHEIKDRLTVELAAYTPSGIDELQTNIRNGEVHAMAQIHTPVKVDSNIIKRMEDQLAEKLGMPVNLVIREVSTNIVSAKGSDVAVVDRNLDGLFIDKKIRPEVRELQTAEEVINSYLQDRTDLHLVTADFFHEHGKPVVLARIAGFRQLAPSEINSLQETIRKDVNKPDLELVLRFQHIALYTANGPILPGWETTITPSEQEQQTMDALVLALRKALDQNEYFMLGSVHQEIDSDGYTILANLNGSGLFGKKDLIELQSALQGLSNKAVKLYAWLNQGIVMTDKGPTSYQELYLQRRAKRNPEDMKLIEHTLKRVR